jgi:hypothetical protein
MRSIQIEVPDSLADCIEAASDRQKMVWAYRLASIVEEDFKGSSLRTALDDIEAWRTQNGCSDAEFDGVFAELAVED